MPTPPSISRRLLLTGLAAALLSGCSDQYDGVGVIDAKQSRRNAPPEPPANLEPSNKRNRSRDGEALGDDAHAGKVEVAPKS